MLKIIIEKELKDIIGSSKFVITFAVCSLLILLTFYVGAKNYQINKSQYEASVAENLRSMKDLTDWRMVQHKIFLPPMPLASLVGGVSNDIGRQINMAGLGELTPTESKYNEDPIYAVFRFLDLDFLFQIILSLFAILFTYNAVNGEKEGGTLALTFANPIPRDKYILGKLIGSFLALAIPLIIPMLLGSLIMPLMGVPMGGEEYGKLALIIFMGFMYFGVFLSLSVFMSIIMKQSSSSFLMMLVIWILSVIIIPRASVIIAGRAVDVPSVDEINRQKNIFNMQASEEFFKKMTTFKPDKESKDPMQGFSKFMGELQEERSAKQKVFNEKVNMERSNKQNVQQNFALGISRISPSACFSLAASNIAGTSLDLVNDFLDQAVAYQDVYKKFQVSKSGSTSGGFTIITRTGGEEEKKIDTAELPQFKYNPPALAKVIGPSLIDFAILFIYNLFFFVGSFVAFLKYDLR